MGAPENEGTPPDSTAVAGESTAQADATAAQQPTVQQVTVSLNEAGEGWSTISAEPANVSIATQPQFGTAGVEPVEGQPEQTCVKVVNATGAIAAGQTSVIVGVSIATAAEPPAAPQTGEPNASESSGTGDQNGGAIEEPAAGESQPTSDAGQATEGESETETSDPQATEGTDAQPAPTEAAESELPVGEGEGQVHPETGQRIPAGGLSDVHVAEPKPEGTVCCPVCGHDFVPEAEAPAEAGTEPSA